MKFFSRPKPFVDSLAVKIPLRKRFGYFWKDLHLLWKTLLVFLVFAILAIPFYGTARKANRKWEFGKDLAGAKQALAAGRHVEARDLSLSLLRRDPKNTEPLPIFMRAAKGAIDSRLVGVACSYLALDTRDKADRVFAWDAISTQGPIGIASMVWFGQIREEERADPDFLAPWLERLFNEEHVNEVEKELAKQPNLTDPRVERIHLLTLAKRGTQVSFRELQARLLDHLAKHPADGPQLLEALDKIPQNVLIPYSFTALEEWIKACGGEPSVEDKLRLARCEMAAHPEITEAILARVTAAHVVTDPLQLARLFFTLERFDKVEEILQPLVAKGDPGVFELMAKVLEHSGDLEKWDKLLETLPKGGDSSGYLLDRAFIASKRGDDLAQPKFKQEALTAAEALAESDSLIRLARRASRRDMAAYASDVWVKAICDRPSSPLPFFSSISHVVGSLAKDRKELQLFNVLSVYRNLEPGNLEIVTQYFYLAGLNGTETPAKVLEKLVPISKEIRSLPLNCTVALANVLEGNYALANKLTDDKNIDWFKQIPSLRAIRAIVLTQIGCKEEADIYMENFPWDRLLLCEERVFRQLLENTVETKKVEDVEKVRNAEKAGRIEKARQARVAEKASKIIEMESGEEKEAREAKEAKKIEETGKIIKIMEAEAARKAKAIEEIRKAKEAKEAGKQQGGNATPPEETAPPGSGQQSPNGGDDGA